jgi:asparaginyl-tRNA synthetase
VAEVIRIADIADYVGQEVTLRGWVYAKTGKGRLQFIRLRDGSGQIQCVAFKKEMPEADFERAKSLTQESSITVTGTVREDDRADGFPAGYEVGLNSLEIIQLAEGYPITPKEHGTEFLMDRRHLWLRSNQQWAALRVRATIIKAFRDWLDDNGFMLVDTPIITPAAGEETTTLFEIDYFEDEAYLAQTGQLYNEANIMAFGKVYCFGPVFRAEKSKTRRHLIEFWMLEPEIAFCSLEELMDIQEQMMVYTVQQVLDKNRQELEILERDISQLETISSPFARISYDEAIDRLQKHHAGLDDGDEKDLLAIEWGEDFGAPHETALAKMFDQPVFVYHYPSAVKAFYMQPVDGRPEVCRCVDLLAPEGYGEIIGGSERIYDKDLLEQKIEEHGFDRANYEWYLDLREFGSVPHAGFGIGIERTVAWLCGLQHIRETTPYPRLLNRKYP